MILTDGAILEEMKRGSIVIDPSDRRNLGTNSFDIHLSRHLAYYKNKELDAKVHNEVERLIIPEEGIWLEPFKLYLGSTVEYTETHEHIPWLDGKSSGGRLGLFVHVTAGRGDAGFCNHWTLELLATQRVKVYAGMPLGQMSYFVKQGDILVPYDKKKDAKYNERNPLPVESMMFKNYDPVTGKWK